MIIDCTQTLITEFPGYPDDETTFAVEPVEEGDIITSAVGIGCHFGTHIDTPKHFYPQKPGIENFATESLHQTALWLFCEPAGLGFTLAPSIDIWSLPKVDWIFFYTGWSEKWGTKGYYENFPGLEQVLVEDLAEIDVTGIGLDAPSPDPIPNTKRPNHYTWLREDRYILENLRWNDDIADGEVYSTFIVPLKMEGVEASPCRVFHEIS